MPQKERRKHHRAKVVWPVIMENNRNIISGETQDISAGGAYIRCRKPLKPAEVSMYVSVSLLSPRIRAMAEVVRLDVLGSYNGVEYYGIGVRFVATHLAWVAGHKNVTPHNNIGIPNPSATVIMSLAAKAILPASIPHLDNPQYTVADQISAKCELRDVIHSFTYPLHILNFPRVHILISDPIFHLHHI
jgi:hypothetical protein